MNRRQLIMGAGGAVALVSGGALWRVTRMPQTATRPWQIDPVPITDVRLDAFRHAILAPNPHNRQPWIIRLTGKDGAEVSCDLDRRLPHTDPFDRQTVIGFGAFLELARITAAERGFAMSIDRFPDGEPYPRLDSRLVARLTFAKDAAVPRDPLFTQIVRRRSNKETYDRKQVPAALAQRVAGRENGYTVDQARIAPLRAAILDAVAIETRTRRTYMESVKLIRIGHEAIDVSPDGIDLDGPMIEALRLAGQIDQDVLADMGSLAYRSGLDGMIDTYGSIPALIWIATGGNARSDQLDAGRRYVRANLRATALGVAMHPMSQALQEYREVAEPMSLVHDLLLQGVDARVQMLARIGFAPPVGPSPRWPLESRITA